MKYDVKVKSRLECYKEKHLGIADKGEWDGKEYGHILPDPDTNERLNIIETYRKDFYNSDKSNINYHKYFHHLNSSQAMCINFFYPLIKEKKLNIITEFLGFPDEEINYSASIFEKKSTLDNNRNGNPTNFDFYIKTNSGKNFYFEIKYTEAEFGTADDDPPHQKRFVKEYEKLLQAKVNTKYYDRTEFFKNYQIIRNLIHVDNDSYVIFIYPYENKKIRKGAELAYSEILLDKYKKHFFKIIWRTLIDTIYPETHSRNLHKCYTEFDLKYL